MVFIIVLSNWRNSAWY